ncbi:GNAT family N-acetyltransferase [uncultured Muribaculum sp.]|uniref:GNAT family N-acetyltransferase n=1 Tax=uncultured Muribaculum sp. TaxID=1918613 RepID=UPI0025D8D045|nr:GNAT family N-acetyltransferase [uncultured Muribaculum sp.]
MTTTTTNHPVIDPVAVELIESELTPDRLLRDTNKGGNKIYIVDAFSAPNVMREVGRLREIAFRAAGGGTGKECDIDEFDTMDPPCRQLVVWDPEVREIIGGYRFIPGNEIRLRADGMPRIATSHMFRFSERFLRDYLPYTIELGRSFVRLEYQSTRVGVKALYALDNLWDGLGALTVIYPDMRYLFGKVTMYPSYNADCRNMILYFLTKHFPDHDRLVWPITPLTTHMDNEAMKRLFTCDTFKDDYKILNRAIREHGYNIPPLVNAYMSLSPSMRMFGTAINDEFGDVEESGIFFVIDEIFEEKKGRHIGTFIAPPLFQGDSLQE